MDLAKLKQNLSKTQLEIQKASEETEKTPDEIELVAVTKLQTTDTIRQIYNEGIRNIGENYLQEALPKIELLRDLDIVWHFIGSIQSNKTRQIANNFSWVHSVDSLKICQRLSRQCPESKTLNLLIQVNIDDDKKKGGIKEQELEHMISIALSLPKVRIRGLMVILSERTDPKAGYDKASEIFENLKLLKCNQENIYWDTLSMGMSKDFYQAILSGSSTVRLGTTLFGDRNK